MAVRLMKTTAKDKCSTLIGQVFNRSASEGEIVQRSAADPLVRTVEVRQVDEEARTAEVAFASETPVRRWFGDEVLSLEQGSMRTERLEGGMAVLWCHDWGDQIGVVESFSIGADRIARAVLRFSKGARASEIFADIQDGIRRHVSVGYRVHGVQIEERSEQVDLVTLIDWEPLEISIVAVPADATVGVGRSAETVSKPPEAPQAGADDDAAHEPAARGAEPKRADMKTRTLRDSNGNLVRAKVDENGKIVEVLETIEEAGEAERAALQTGSSDERRRVTTLMEMGRQYDAQDMASQYVTEGRTVEAFRDALLTHLQEQRGGSEVTERNNTTGMSERDASRYSFVRALRYLMAPNDRAVREAASFEIEAGEAAAEALGATPRGLLVPPEVLNHRALNTGTGGVAAGDTGGNLVATTLQTQSFIDLLRNRMVSMQLATPLTGLVGLIDIPKLTEGAQGYWIDEDDDAPETTIGLGQISAAPKTAAALHEITRRMLMQSSMDVEALVRRDVATALAQTVDRAFFYGTGAGNQPIGIANLAGINAVDFAAANPTFGEIIQMESEIGADNADVDTMAYVCNARMRGHFKSTEKFAGTGRTIWEEGGTVNGYRAEVTNQIDNGDVFHGNFADAVLAQWGGLDLTVDPYTHSAKGRVRIVAFKDVDFVHRRVESFCLGTMVP
jgi:HK97 family phage major capsid protein